MVGVGRHPDTPSLACGDSIKADSRRCIAIGLLCIVQNAVLLLASVCVDAGQS